MLSAERRVYTRDPVRKTINIFNAEIHEQRGTAGLLIPHVLDMFPRFVSAILVVGMPLDFCDRVESGGGMSISAKSQPLSGISPAEKWHESVGPYLKNATRTSFQDVKRAQVSFQWYKQVRIKSYKMSHCQDEHAGHGHDHGHDHSHGGHDHSDDLTPAIQNHIYQQIDFDAINTLNESSPRAGSKICQKTWAERLNLEPELCSDADEQLLMHIP